MNRKMDFPTGAHKLPKGGKLYRVEDNHRLEDEEKNKYLAGNSCHILSIWRCIKLKLTKILKHVSLGYSEHCKLLTFRAINEEGRHQFFNLDRKWEPLIPHE